jgi:hypothetical protein
MKMKMIAQITANFHLKLILSYILFDCFFFVVRNCIIGPKLDVKICALGTVINRLAYPADYCHLEGTGRQSQPMPIRWMAWESILMVSNFPNPKLKQLIHFIPSKTVQIHLKIRRVELCCCLVGSINIRP